MHILVFLVAGLIALTFAHPIILVTDEWVTTNQLAQLYEGHQVIINEGKYGSLENGTPSQYFIVKENYLAYSLFLPIISLPSAWLVYGLGDNFVFLILYLWTFLLIAFALVLNAFFPEYTFVCKWRWTNGLIAGAFLIFFINLFFYQPFHLTGKEWYPEVVAIVFTHIVLFAFLAVLIFEICRTLFENDTYSFFGTFVCLSCSSCLFWTTYCKDHILVAFLVTLIILLLVKFLHTETPLYLCGAFVTSGLLAWARPEVALFMAFVLCIIVLYFTFFSGKKYSDKQKWHWILLSPVFTFLGAVPFFINNYLVTRNIFLPAFIRWNITSSSSAIADAVPVQQNTSDTLGSLFHLIQAETNIQPSTFLTDLFGVLFAPQSGSMGVFPLVPLFLAAIVLLPLVVFRDHVRFSAQEKTMVASLLLISMGIFFAYIRGIAGMNISLGMFPDIRYLSPIYLPLTLVGLIIINKIPALSDKPLTLVIGMVCAWIVLIPVSLIGISRFYPHPAAWKDLFPSLDIVMSLGIYLLVLMFLICTILSIVYHTSSRSGKLFLVIICALPLVWQIDATFIVRHFGSGMGGYSFWIPVVLKWYELIF